MGTTNNPSSAATTKGSLIDRRRGVLNFKEIAKIPQEVTVTLWIFPNAENPAEL